MHTRRIIGAAAFAVAVVAVGACYDFDTAAEQCLDSGRCAPDDAGLEPPADAGTQDAGEEDGGMEPPDGGDTDAGLDGGEDAGMGSCASGFTLAAPFRLGAWEWEHPLPQGNPLNAVSGWGKKVWVGGNSGVLMEIDDCRIRQLPLPVSTAIRSIGGRGEDYFDVVGDTGANFEFAGGNREPLLEAAFSPNESLRTVGVAPGAALVARNVSGNGMHLYVDITDGIASPASGPNSQTVVSASGTTSNWWVIGLDGKAYQSDNLLPGTWTEHLDGGAGYSDVWVSTDQKAWVAGEGGFLWSSNGFVSNQEGTPAQFASSAGGTADLIAVSGAQNNLAAAQDVYAVVSDQGDLFRRVGRTTPTWTAITPMDGGSFIQGAYGDVWVRPFTAQNAGGEVWAVGAGGAIVTDVLAKQWHEVTSTFSDLGKADVVGIDGVGDEVFAVSENRVLRRTAQGRWQQLDPQPPGDLANLHDLVALSADHLFVIGDDTTVLEFVGGQWSTWDIEALGGGTRFSYGDSRIKLRAISTSDTHSVWAVGSYYPSGTFPVGFAARWDDTTNTWKQFEAGTVPLTHVSSLGASAAWAVGADTVVKLGGVTSSPYPVSGRTFESVYATASGTVYVGGQGFIGTFNPTNSTVTDAQLPDGGTLQNQNFWDATLSANGPLFVGGAGAGMVLDGGTVYPLAPGTTHVLRGVYVDLSKDTVWTVGDDATILRRFQ